MFFKAKLLLLNLLINIIIISLSFISIQNASKKNFVNFSSFKSVEVPIGLILSLSFILGSSTGSTLLFFSKENHKSPK
mgnify:CR=1 FL=1